MKSLNQKPDPFCFSFAALTQSPTNAALKFDPTCLQLPSKPPTPGKIVFFNGIGAASLKG